jgi:LssY C-terminus
LISESSVPQPALAAAGGEWCHATGQITHVAAHDVVSERDYFFYDLWQASEMSTTHVVNGFSTIVKGRNRGGKSWQADGGR